MSQIKYKRVLLKLSGEALAAGGDDILNFDFIAEIAKVLKMCVADGVEIAIIVGAGNIWRGKQGGGMDRVKADSMGMLATTINALALQDTFIQNGLDTVVMTSVDMIKFAEPYTIRNADKALSEGKIVVLGCGVGAPYFSTDTAAALRAAEIGADVVLMAKNIDGIYTADPHKDPTAVKYDEISYYITRHLKRGVTLLDSVGYYSGKDGKVITTIARANQSNQLLSAVKQIDPNALISQSKVMAVYGLGFDKIKAKVKAVKFDENEPKELNKEIKNDSKNNKA